MNAGHTHHKQRSTGATCTSTRAGHMRSRAFAVYLPVVSNALNQFAADGRVLFCDRG